MKWYFTVLATLFAISAAVFAGVQIDRHLHDIELRPSTTKVEGTQFTRKYVKPPPRSPRYQRWVDLPMNRKAEPRYYCVERGKDNRFDTLQRWDPPRIGTALTCRRAEGGRR